MSNHKQTFVIWPDDSDEVVAQRLDAARMFALAMPRDRAFDIIIARHAKPRSASANAYLFGVCYRRYLCPVIGHTVDEWHEFMCGDYFGWDNQRMIGRRGMTKPIRTTTVDEAGYEDVLEPDEFWAFVEHVRMRGAEAGVVIPDPTPEDVAAYEEFWINAKNAAV